MDEADIKQPRERPALCFEIIVDSLLIDRHLTHAIATSTARALKRDMPDSVVLVRDAVLGVVVNVEA